MNIFQWNFIGNSKVFIQENALENVVCEMAAILSRPQCVNKTTILYWNVDWMATILHSAQNNICSCNCSKYVVTFACNVYFRVCLPDTLATILNALQPDMAVTAKIRLPSLLHIYPLVAHIVLCPKHSIVTLLLTLCHVIGALSHHSQYSVLFYVPTALLLILSYLRDITMSRSQY